jgi:hypothetical protein
MRASNTTSIGKNPMIHAAAIREAGAHTAQPNKHGAGNICREQLAPARALQRAAERGRTEDHRRSGDATGGAHGSAGRRRRRHPVKFTRQTDNYNLQLARAPIAVASTPPDRRRRLRAQIDATCKHIRIIGGRGEKKVICGCGEN